MVPELRKGSSSHYAYIIPNTTHLQFHDEAVRLCSDSYGGRLPVLLEDADIWDMRGKISEAFGSGKSVMFVKIQIMSLYPICHNVQGIFVNSEQKHYKINWSVLSLLLFWGFWGGILAFFFSLCGLSLCWLYCSTAALSTLQKD